MPESTVVRNKRDGQIIITDGSKTYTIDKETGDFSFDVPGESVSLYLDRGSIGTTPSIRNVDDQPITGSFTVHHRDLPQTTYTTMADIAMVLASQYVTGNWTSTIGSSSDVRTFTIQYTIDGTAFGEADRTLTFTFCVIRASFAEGDPNTLSVTFTSYQLKPTVS